MTAGVRFPDAEFFRAMSKDAEQIYSGLKNVFTLHVNELAASHADCMDSISIMWMLFQLLENNSPSTEAISNCIALAEKELM